MSKHSYSNRAITNFSLWMGKWIHKVLGLNLVHLCLNNLRSVRERQISRINISKYRWNCQHCLVSSRTITKARSVCLVGKWFIYSRHSRMPNLLNNNYHSTKYRTSRWSNFRVSIIFLKRCSNPSNRLSTCRPCRPCRFWTKGNLPTVSTSRAKGSPCRISLTQSSINSSSMARSSSMGTCTNTIKSLLESTMAASGSFLPPWCPTNRPARWASLTSSRLSVRCSSSTTRIEAFVLFVSTYTWMCANFFEEQYLQNLKLFTLLE